MLRDIVWILCIRKDVSVIDIQNQSAQGIGQIQKCVCHSDSIPQTAGWQLSARPELKDSEIVANISNVILRPLAFSPIR